MVCPPRFLTFLGYNLSPGERLRVGRASTARSNPTGQPRAHFAAHDASAARAARPLGHDALRHTAASLAVSAGASVKSVQRMLGHSSAAMTFDVYSGLFDDDLDAVADHMDEAFTRSLADFSRTAAAVVALPTTGQGV
jgi:integrase